MRYICNSSIMKSFFVSFSVADHVSLVINIFSGRHMFCIIDTRYISRKRFMYCFNYILLLLLLFISIICFNF